MSASLFIYVAKDVHCPPCKGAFVTKVLWITTVAIKITFEEPISTTVERCKISTENTEHNEWRREKNDNKCDGTVKDKMNVKLYKVSIFV